MAKKETDYKQLAEEILALVGGEENIDNVIHCITRLRFYLKDDSKADKESLEDLSGVMGIVEANNQFQVIVGQAVDEIYKELTALLPNQQEEKEAESPSRFKDQKTFMGKVRYGFNQVIGVITGAVMPIIHILAASGIIKSVLAIGTTSGWITESGSAYLIINAMADTVFYFLPILIGYNAAKRLGGNPVLTAVIGGVIMYPSILEAAEEELLILSVGPVDFPYVAYTYSIFPMILAAWLVKILEDRVRKWLPSYIQSIFTPIIVMSIVVAVTFLFTGPVITWISLGLAEGLQVLLSWNAAIFGGIIAGLYQILVIFGLHWGIIPIYVNDFALLGYSYLSAIVSFSIVGQAGAALGVAVKSKKPKIKELGYAGTISAFCGITEPAIYGINLRFRRPFIAASIGSAVGGFFTGLLRVNMWSIIGSIIGLPSYIDPDAGINSNFWYAVMITILTLVVSCLITYFWGYNDDMKMEQKREKPKNPGKVVPE
ncbi:PTS system, beta-glucosides-specific IIC component [Atopostipes suicloacalis DSM 15692]|uniref:PTS system, beta-glucosides-specific IIC component n=1 Tax=Atopostipes suicloacalis DSM 15692 TaxID=1121025 RepID=A0A1M4XGI8_9LACT|nr:PTS transporter subunit EIIC [Atopostipes suicloacalis]SHE92282.1 PTS system, beta-glucosides-specific IIC component [Atopostipes suicloacalis DSM 15692]